MRAARVNLVVETGAVFSKAFCLMVPTGQLQAASDIIVGDRFFLDRVPSRVAALTRANGWSNFIMDQGLWYDPHVSIPDHEMVQRAAPVAVTDAKSAFWVEGAPVFLPLVISADGFAVAIEMTEDDTNTLVPLEGAWPWDIYVTTADTGRMRLAEGTLSIVRGQTFTPYVEPLKGARHGHLAATG